MEGRRGGGGAGAAAAGAGAAVLVLLLVVRPANAHQGPSNEELSIDPGIPLDLAGMLPGRIGGRCLYDSDCTALHASCLSGICRCHKRMRPTVDGLHCYLHGRHVVDVGGYCESHLSCKVFMKYDDTSCNYNRCLHCLQPKWSSFYGNKCYTTARELGAYCGTYTPCFLPRDGLEQAVDCMRVGSQKPHYACQCVAGSEPSADLASCLTPEESEYPFP